MKRIEGNLSPEEVEKLIKKLKYHQSQVDLLWIKINRFKKQINEER